MRQTGEGDAVVPPGWPGQVRPPGAPDWEQSAGAWLFDLVPPDYRAHAVLRRYPVLLARFAGDHVAAGLEAARAGWRTGRGALAPPRPPARRRPRGGGHGVRAGGHAAGRGRPRRRGRGRRTARRALGAAAVTPVAPARPERSAGRG